MKTSSTLNRLLTLLIITLMVSSCATFYEKTSEFNAEIEAGNFDKAEAYLSNVEKAKDGKNRFLYFVNAGIVASMQGKYEESNAYFEQADLFVEDYRKNFMEEGGALLLNPNISTYAGEDHEVLMINYYKALNYLQLQDFESALVEVRRMDIRLQQLSDKYQSDRKYKKDAFIHTLMGIIYDANQDYNNAFIAYRNAYNIYQNEYSEMFGISAPEQLKKDIIRTARLTGLDNELTKYEKAFGMKYQKEDKTNMVLLWNNGLGPVKDEMAINFMVVHTRPGWVTFVNDDFGFSFPYYYGNSDMRGLTWIRVVFPKYVERPSLYANAAVELNGQSFPLELAQNVNAVAFKTLDERMLAEFSKSLLRVALKQAVAQEAAKEDQGLGIALQIFGAVSETADTRNWQTIPHSISYTRVPIEEGNQNVEIALQTTGGQTTKEEINVEGVKGQTVVVPYFSMDVRNSPLQ